MSGVASGLACEYSHLMWLPPESSERSICDLSWKITYWWRQSARNSGIASEWLELYIDCSLEVSTVNSWLTLSAILTLTKIIMLIILEYGVE